nr:unnamed protein product [Callosobruchus chinensis]
MNKIKVDTELLICAIEEKKCIWDVSSEDYKNRDMKSKAFMDVAAVVVQNFEELNEKEKEEASKKLETIRTSR